MEQAPQPTTHETENIILTLSDVDVFHGQIQALHGINLKVKRGEIVTILGSNGAGKTTTLRTISGLNKISKGTITFKGERIDHLSADKIVGKGIAQSPEGRMVFPQMTVEENLDLGAYLRRDKAGIKKDKEEVFLLFPRLKERLKQQAGTLSGGEQQMLAIGRALMAKPDLLLLDEPSLGIAPILVQTIFKAIKEINARGMTILLVEQNAFAALNVAQHGHILETGYLTLQGKAQDLLHNEDVRKAYLGE
jgi:branched-chain amino acid transport system ATP-binding protein